MDNENTTASGIRVAEDGSRIAGGSVRADGSVRKTVKIRPGFVPAEDVAKYVPRAKRLNQQGAVQPGGGQRPVRSISGKDSNVAANGASMESKPEDLGSPSNDKPHTLRPVRPVLQDEPNEDDIVQKLDRLSIGSRVQARSRSVVSSDEPMKKPEDYNKSKKSSHETGCDHSIDNASAITGYEKEKLDGITRPKEPVDKEAKGQAGRYIPPWKRNQEK